MANISFGGLGNGFDFQQVVNQLVAAKQVPIDQLSANQQTLQSKLTDYQTLGSDLLALQTSAGALNLSTSFDRFTASSSDANVLSASAASGATPGNYTVNVTQLAAAQQIINKATTSVASTTTSIVSGASANFSFTVGSGTQQTVTLASGASLDDLKTAINDLGAGVTASILNTGTETTPAYRLVVNSTTSGTANAITINADGTSLDFLNTSGTGGTDTLQAAQDAIIVLGDPTGNPVTIQRSTNTITDAIAGVTLSLKSKTPAGSTDNVAVGIDTASIKSNIKALVSAYNTIVTFIDARNTYDSQKQLGGTFFAEGTPKTIQSRLRQALTDDVGGLTGLTAVAQLGFQTQRDGTITIDDSKLDDALNTNYTGIKNLFIGQASSTGVGKRISDAVDALDAVDNGALALHENELTTNISDLGKSITQKQDALSQYQEQLQLQYAQLDGLLRQMQTTLAQFAPPSTSSSSNTSSSSSSSTA
jgi:flagellar hook-associated protein 2